MEALGDGGGTVVEIVTDRTREACLHVLPLRLQNSHLLLHYHMNLGYKRFAFFSFLFFSLWVHVKQHGACTTTKKPNGQTIKFEALSLISQKQRRESLKLFVLLSLVRSGENEISVISEGFDCWRLICLICNSFYQRGWI